MSVKQIVIIIISIMLFSCSQEANLYVDNEQLKYQDSDNTGIENLLIFDFDVVNNGADRCDIYKVKIYMDFENNGEVYSKIYNNLDAAEIRHFIIEYDKGAKDLLDYNITVTNGDKYKL